MFCKKCGAQLGGEEQTCPNCGAELNGTHDNSEPAEKEAVVTVEEIRQNLTTEDGSTEISQKKKFPVKLPIVFGIVAAIILIASITIFALKSDMFKSPKDLYLEIEGENAMHSINKLVDSAERYYDKYMTGKPTETKVKLSGDVDLSKIPGIDSSVASTVSKLLKDLEITIDSKNNPKESQNIFGLGVSMKGFKLLNGELIQNKEKYALSVPALYSKYIVLDMKDLNSLMGNFGVSGTGSLTSITGKDVYKAIKFDKKDFIKLLKSYGKTLSDSIDEKQVTLEKGVDFKINNLTVKCNKLTLSMDQKSFEKTVISLLDKAKDDELLYSLTVENLMSIMKLYQKSGYTMEGIAEIQSQLSKKNFKKGIAELEKTLEDGFKTISMPDGVKMTLYVDGHTIIGRTFETKIKDKETDESFGLSINYNGVSNYKDRNIFSLEIKASGDASSDDAFGIEEISAKVNYDTTIDNDIEKGKLKIVLGGKGQSFSANVFNADIGVKIDRSNGADSAKYAYDYDITAGIPMSKEYNLKGKLGINTWEKEKEKKNGSDIKLSIDFKSMQSPDEKFSGTFDIKTETAKDIEFKMPDIKSSNSLNIAKASSEELNDLYNEIMEAVQKLALMNPDIMNMFSEASTSN